MMILSINRVTIVSGEVIINSNQLLSSILPKIDSIHPLFIDLVIIEEPFNSLWMLCQHTAAT